MEKLNKRGIFTLHDLMSKGLGLHKLDLIKEWDNILFYDVTIKSNHKRIKDFNNPIYWNGLIDNRKNETFRNPKTKTKHTRTKKCNHHGIVRVPRNEQTCHVLTYLPTNLFIYLHLLM